MISGFAADERHRRELGSYLRFTLGRGDVGAVMMAVRGAVEARRAKGRPPRALRLDAAAGPNLNAAPPLPVVPIPVAGHGTRLATRDWRLADGPPWAARFEDPEDEFSAHRFGWALPMLAEARARRDVLALANAWMDAHRIEANAPGCDSYSLAERIVHWVYVLCALTPQERTAARPLVERIVQSLSVQADLLRSRLEFRGEATNNHLINDGRALYLAAVLLGRAPLADVGRQLLAFGAEQMFVSGFLREGSTHYQLLLCRSYTEVLLAARAARDTQFADAATEWVTAMLRALCVLPRRAGIPLIGDASPDFVPAYHLDVAAVAEWAVGAPFVRSTRGWAGLFAGGQPIESCDEESVGHAEALPDAGYYRLKHARWDLFAYVNPIGHVPQWSHGHADVGSFVADFNDAPLFVDGGRSTYRPTPLGRYGRSVRSHNALSIDRHEPCVVHGLNGLVPMLRSSYYARPPRVERTCSARPLYLRIEHHGFTRVARGLVAIRTVVLDDANLQIVDDLCGSGRHDVEVFFHLHPSVTVSVESAQVATCAMPGGARVALRANGVALRAHVRGQHSPEPAGWYADAYGSVVPCSTLIFGGAVELPARFSFQVSPC